MVSALANFARYGALGLGIVYGVWRNASLNKKEQYEHKQLLQGQGHGHGHDDHTHHAAAAPTPVPAPAPKPGVDHSASATVKHPAGAQAAAAH